MATYTATSPRDLADGFERMAENAARSADAAVTEKMRALWRRESRTWSAAADMLRNTEFTPAPLSPAGERVT